MNAMQRIERQIEAAQSVGELRGVVGLACSPGVSLTRSDLARVGELVAARTFALVLAGRT